MRNAVDARERVAIYAPERIKYFYIILLGNGDEQCHPHPIQVLALEHIQAGKVGGIMAIERIGIHHFAILEE